MSLRHLIFLLLYRGYNAGLVKAPVNYGEVLEFLDQDDVCKLNSCLAITKIIDLEPLFFMVAKVYPEEAEELISHVLVTRQSHLFVSIMIG